MTIEYDLRLICERLDELEKQSRTINLLHQLLLKDVMRHEQQLHPEGWSDE
jgi:hypothetical protein